MEIIKKNLSKKRKILILVLILVFAFCLVFLLNFLQKKFNIPLNKQVNINSEIPIVEANAFSVKKEVVFGLPVNLKIPSIKVDANVEYLGLTRDGSMDAPNEPSEVGWYNLGPRPGEIGNAVIDGHSGWRNNTISVFDNLDELKIGEKVFVENDMGMTITFVVREVKIYDPNADAYDVFVSNDGKSHLNIITCTGFWNKILKSHSSRLVVFTDKLM